MSYATVAGVDIIDAKITMPRTGPWVLDCSVDATAALDVRQMTAKFGDALQLTGTPWLSAAAFNTTMVRLMPGMAKLSALPPPRHYRNVQVRTVLTDLFAVSGDQLASSAAQDVLSLQLDHWTVLQQSVGIALTRLCERAGADVVWRGLPDGSIWLGRETWPAVQPKHDLLTEDPLNDRIVVSSLDRWVLPGDAFLGRHVSYVEHHMLDGMLRSQVYFE